MDEQYGFSSYGSVKYNKDVMYWCGYLYRYLSYCYDIQSKQAYAMLSLKYVASTYKSYHTLDVAQAIERLLETKHICLSEEDINKKGVIILRRIRQQELYR